MTDIALEQGAFFVDKDFSKTYGKKKREKQRKSTVSTRRASKERNCENCKLFESCESPKMEPFGKGDLGIVIVGESPGAREDIKGRPFVGPSGKLLREALAEFDISRDNDCIMTNTIQCKIPDEEKEKATKSKMKFWKDCCKKRLESQLLALKPTLIIALGADAMSSVLFDAPLALTSNGARGLVFPSRKYGCWVACCWHPSYVLRDRPSKFKIFCNDIGNALSKCGEVIPPLLSEKMEMTILNDREEIKEFFTKKLLKTKNPVSFDYETNRLSSYSKTAKILCVSFAFSPVEVVLVPFHIKNIDPSEFKKEMSLFFKSSIPKIIHNFAFENKWSKVFFGTTINALLNDTMVTSHVIREKKMFSTSGKDQSFGKTITGLKFQTYLHWGDLYAKDIDVENLEQTPLEVVAKYCCTDSCYTYGLHIEQRKFFEKNKEVLKAADFFITSLPTISESEIHGWKLDFELLKKLKSEAQTELDTVEETFEKEGFLKKFTETTGKDSFGFRSDNDLRSLFYDVLKCPHPDWKTKGGKLPVDKNALDFIAKHTKDGAVVQLCSDIRTHSAYATKLSTFLIGYEKAIHDDGLMHPDIFLHVPESFRSSSANPNSQNIPKRDAKQKDIRMLFIPQFDYLGEIDASGSEIATMGMLTEDEMLTKQIQDGYDLHKYWASLIYEVKIENVTDLQRFNAKNKFLFPEFYGSWFKTIAKDLGLPEHHIQKIEKLFWKMYKGIKKWQQHVSKQYARNFYIEMPLGFRRYAPLTQNQIFNTAVQGTSFHMLLRSMRDLAKDIKDRKLKSRISGEVHDSILLDIVENEIEEVCELAYKRMTEKQWDWQGVVPRRADLAIGRNWGEMVKV